MTAEPLPRILADDGEPGPPACEFPDGTPHPDPYLAERGWQVVHGTYARVAPVAGEEPAA